MQISTGRIKSITQKNTLAPVDYSVLLQDNLVCRGQRGRFNYKQGNKMIELTKRCAKCGIVKPSTEFSKDRYKKSNLRSYCKNCAQILHHKYYYANYTKKKQYYQKNKTRILSQHQKYREANREQLHLNRRNYAKNRYNNPNTNKQLIRHQRGKQYWAYAGGKPVHTAIAEQVLGRKFKKNENVHHFDDNGLNNEHNNLLICTRSYHQYLHQKMKTTGGAN
jgi:hypothetical protein